VPGELIGSPEGTQSAAKLSLLISKAVSIRKHWGNLNSFLKREFLVNKF
jgi:hypothetical protein